MLPATSRLGTTSNVLFHAVIPLVPLPCDTRAIKTAARPRFLEVSEARGTGIWEPRDDRQ
jgi:hypothetical protein